MNLASELFRLADRVSNDSGKRPPVPHATSLVAPGLGREQQPRYLLLGNERQFHERAGELCQFVAADIFDNRDRHAWHRQRGGLLELVRRFFRRKRFGPALVWGAPVWMLTRQWVARAGLVAQDETDRITRRGLGAAASRYHPLRFAGGQRLKVNVSALRFFYPEDSQTLIHVPRSRKLLTQSGRLVGVGYEEGLGLAAAGEKSALVAGTYTPNELFFRSRLGLEYLDLLTVTFARLVPDPPAEKNSFAKLLERSEIGARSPWSDRIARDFAKLLAAPVDREHHLPTSARVQFVRLTLHPDDLRIVVLLAAERELSRFIVEHDGLAQLLMERLAAERMRG